MLCSVSTVNTCEVDGECLIGRDCRCLLGMEQCGGEAEFGEVGEE